MILTFFPSRTESTDDSDTGEADGIQSLKVLVRVRRPDIQERVAALGNEHLGDDSFDSSVLADVRCSFIGWNDGRGLSTDKRRR